MDAIQYWSLYRSYYESMVTGYVQIKFDIFGEASRLDESLFERANTFAAGQTQKELEFQIWKSKGSYAAEREFCYGEVSA